MCRDYNVYLIEQFITRVCEPKLLDEILHFYKVYDILSRLKSQGYMLFLLK